MINVSEQSRTERRRLLEAGGALPAAGLRERKGDRICEEDDSYSCGKDAKAFWNSKRVAADSEAAPGYLGEITDH